MKPVMRHAIFGNIADENILHIVPEAEVTMEILRKSGGRQEVRVKFKGQSVTIPHGTAVQFQPLQAVTERGGVGFPEETAQILDINGRKPS